MDMGPFLTASKFSAELTSVVTDKLKTAPDEYIDVRIFLEQDAILEKVTAELDSKGLKIRNVIEGPDVLVTGSIAVENLYKINTVAEVDRIEHDHIL
jgi:ACT domain-containing protein